MPPAFKPPHNINFPPFKKRLLPRHMKRYDSWSKEDLIGRIVALERVVKKAEGPLKSAIVHRSFDYDFSRYSTRKIALKFCYNGWEYSGLAAQAGETPLPTVESVIFDAMVVTHLIDPAKGFDGCEWEKCGRTDAGVSAAGQVISLRIRSAFVDESRVEALTPTPEKAPEPESEVAEYIEDDVFGAMNIIDFEPPPRVVKKVEQEFDYVATLNRILPPSIRMLSWSPVSPSFSARFSCKHRHYKYFFSGSGLDIPHMQAAAKLLVGTHDFRNFCKLDISKQITVFDREIYTADIVPVANVVSGMYVLNLIGSAFLYNQVRHVVAILFLIGKGLEDPSLVSHMLNVQDGNNELQVVRSKPVYEIADPLPLVLWDCVYGEGDFDWQDAISDPSQKRGFEPLSVNLARSSIQTVLHQHFFEALSNHQTIQPANTKVHVPLGAGTVHPFSNYIPVLQRPRLDTVEVRNARWLAKKAPAIAD